MRTACLRIAAIGGADIAVITVKRSAVYAFASDTALLSITHSKITTVTVVITLTAGNLGMETPLLGITGISGATIAIITGDGASRLTCPTHTPVPCGADTPVITG